MLQGEQPEAWEEVVMPEAVKATVVLGAHIFLTGAALQAAVGRLGSFLVMLGLVALRVLWIGIPEGRKWWVGRKA